MTDYKGELWKLGDENHNGVFLTESGIDGLVGEISHSTITVPGVPGAFVTGSEVGSVSGSLKCHIAPTVINRTGEQIRAERSQLYNRFRGAFHRFKSNRLTVGDLWCDIYLNGKIDTPSGRVEDATQLDISIPVINRSGLWFSSQSNSSSIVTVTNLGDVVIYPKIRWHGEGGRVILPSGASFTLPASPSPLTVSLNPNDGYAVYSGDSLVFDREQWVKIRGSILGEGIPPGVTTWYQLPNLAALKWEVGYLDPWVKEEFR